MATQVQNRRGTTAEHSTFTGAVGELTVDTTKDTVVVHDGAVAGGRPLLREDQSNLPTSAPTTGLYNASGALALSTNGTGRLFVDSSGNVGIGTSAPGTELEVVATSPIIKSRATGNSTAKLALDSNRAASTINGQILGQWNGNTVSRIDFINGADDTNKDDGEIAFSTSNNASSPTERLRITQAGFVGIGTSAPQLQLSVNHVTQPKFGFFVNNTEQYRFQAVSGGNYIDLLNASLLVRGGASGTTNIATITNAGLVGIGTTVPAGNVNIQGATAVPSLTYDTADLINLDSGSIQLAIGINSGAPFGPYLQGRDNANGSRSISLNPAGGNVGIGTASPARTLHVAGEATFINNTQFLVAPTVNNVRLFARDTGTGAVPLSFGVGSSEAARIDSSGRLLLGTSTSTAVGGEQGGFQVAHASGSSASFTRYFAAAAAGPIINFGRSRGALGVQTAVINGDNLGRIRFSGSNGTDLSNTAAEITSEVDGEPFSSGDLTDLPGRLVFSTTADGASSPTERMRITSGGNIGIDTNTFTAATAGRRVLELNGLSSCLINLDVAGTRRAYLYTDGLDTNLNNTQAGDLIFSTSNTERARIDSTGKLLVGTSSSFTGTIQAVTATGGSIGISRNGSSVSAGQIIGSIQFAGNGGDGATVENAADIRCVADGTHAVGDKPGRLVFSTTPDGTASPVERMRIKSSGIINFSNAPVYADNTAALAGGLVAGDVYRKSDGTLMITY